MCGIIIVGREAFNLPRQSVLCTATRFHCFLQHLYTRMSVAVPQLCVSLARAYTPSSSVLYRCVNKANTEERDIVLQREYYMPGSSTYAYSNGRYSNQGVEYRDTYSSRVCGDGDTFIALSGLTTPRVFVRPRSPRGVVKATVAALEVRSSRIFHAASALPMYRSATHEL